MIEDRASDPATRDPPCAETSQLCGGYDPIALPCLSECERFTVNYDSFLNSTRAWGLPLKLLFAVIDLSSIISCLGVKRFMPSSRFLNREGGARCESVSDPGLCRLPALSLIDLLVAFR